MMEKKRIIKKYPNRRLYDTEESRYITLEDVRKLVLDNKDFIIKDVKTDEDLTRNVLLQIIIEREDGGEPLFSIDALAHIIRFYGDSVQSVAGDYIQQSIDLFVNQQRQWREQFSSAVSQNPLTTMAELTEKNMELWKTMNDSFFKAATQDNADAKNKKTDK